MYSRYNLGGTAIYNLRQEGNTRQHVDYITYGCSRRGTILMYVYGEEQAFILEDGGEVEDMEMYLGRHMEHHDRREATPSILVIRGRSMREIWR